jgi:nucleoside-diphosphate-sugar epimerase
MYDFLIIGQGIAGSMFACTALQQGFSVCIIDNNNQYAASNVASGVVNPITGRRMVKTWMADELIPFAINTYKNIEKQLDISFIQEISIAKIISSEADAAIWNGRLNNEDYKNNLSPIQSLNNPNINEAVGVGFIRPTFWMDIKAMIKKFRDFFYPKIY